LHQQLNHPIYQNLLQFQEFLFLPPDFLLFQKHLQSLLVAAALIRRTFYDESLPSSADKLWKRQVIARCAELIYIRRPVVKFYLGGLSSSRFNIALAMAELRHASLSVDAKIAMIIKMLIPPSLYRVYYDFMRCKALACDLFFASPPVLGGLALMFPGRFCGVTSPRAIALNRSS
jgi:hypothetical protein